ncbi:related to AP2 12 [Actinidia rufa]|uniref:Related to AP2 12 n=1 Tax=Actinidia rufa TaxID=165716 RepID=A0A7J0G0J3_9ERIC|nr:related to AP2 12 [Actinidia rufa]
MCGGAIISDIIAPARTRRLTADFLWPSDVKKNLSNYHSKPLRSEIVVLGDDFEADFQDFKDYSDDEDGDGRDFAFSASKSGLSHEEAARAYDAAARKIRGKKAKVNFPDDAPPNAPKRTVKANTQKLLSKESPSTVQPSLNQKFNFINHPDPDNYSMSFVEEKPPTMQYGFTDAYPISEEVGLKSFTPVDDATLYVNSDQGSNSFDCSDFEWGEYNAKTPEISSLLSATIKNDEAQFVQGATPTKKLKPNPVDVVPVEENTVKKLSEELSAFESQMKFFQIPYLEGNWDASVDTFLGGDAAQDGGNSMDLWNFDDMVAGVY